MNKWISVLVCLLVSLSGWSQTLNKKDYTMILDNTSIQVQSTEAIDSMYNFKFGKAEEQFQKLKRKFPEHPLGYFLMALGYHWRIQANESDLKYDKTFFAYIDTAIFKSQQIRMKEPGNSEMSFFLASCYGFKAKRLADLKKYGKSSSDAHACLKYIQEQKELDSLSQHFSVEFQFGVALYNFYREWLPKQRPFLRPLIMTFPKGNAKQGLADLVTVSKEAFYTRIEAMTFLKDIYNGGEYVDLLKTIGVTNGVQKGWEYVEMLHTNYPDNPIFHTDYAYYLYSRGRHQEAFQESQKIIVKVHKREFGYGDEAGRKASFFIAQWMYENEKFSEAKKHYLTSVRFNDTLGYKERPYYRISIHKLAKIYAAENNDPYAKYFYQEFVDSKEEKKEYKDFSKSTKKNKGLSKDKRKEELAADEYAKAKKWLKDHKKVKAKKPY